MNIPASNFMSARIIGQQINEVKYESGNNKLSANFSTVKNSPESGSSATPSVFGAVAGAAAKIVDITGLGKLAVGLKAVGNTLGYVLGIGGKITNVGAMLTLGVQIAQHGIATLVSEVLWLLKDQGFPILDTWLRKIIDDGGHMTPVEVLGSLIETVRDNEKIKHLFHDLSAS